MNSVKLGRSAYLLALTCLLPFISMAATGPTTNEPAEDKSVYISVVDAESTGLVHSMVQLFKLPVVSSLPPTTAPLAFQQTYESWTNAMEDIVRRAGLVAQVQNKLLVMRPICSRLAVSPRGPESTERISLNFQKLPLSTLLEVLKVDPTIAVKDQEAFKNATLTVSVRNGEVGDLLQSAASATGFRWAADAQGKWHLDRETSEDCAFSQKSPTLKARQGYIDGGTKSRIEEYCPHRAQEGQRTRPCDFFELYALHTLRPSGYITLRGHFFAFVETPDRRTGLVRRGDYLGRDFGKVMAIDTDGLDVREIIQDEKDEWVEIKKVLQYGKPPTPTQPIRFRRSYIQQNSPQFIYDRSVSDLFQYTQQWRSSVQLCERNHPEVVDGQQAALEAWRKRNSKAISQVVAHASAYVRRAATDYAVPESQINGWLHENIEQSAEVYFKIAGDMNSSAVRAHCAAQGKRLQDPRNDLTSRFQAELEALDNCLTENTCRNLGD
jgi:hypothetical protein